MRYYEEKYPDVDDLVMVQVRSIAEMGAYVKLVSSEWYWSRDEGFISSFVPLS